MASWTSLRSRQTTMISLTDFASSNAASACSRTDRSPSFENNLSKPTRLLLPAATMMALSMEKSRNVQRSTSNAESSIQRLALDVGFSALGVRRFLLQSLLHFRAQGFPIGTPCHFRL